MDIWVGEDVKDVLSCAAHEDGAICLHDFGLEVGVESSCIERDCESRDKKAPDGS